jgi:hypothetical protein
MKVEMLDNGSAILLEDFTAHGITVPGGFVFDGAPYRHLVYTIGIVLMLRIKQIGRQLINYSRLCWKRQG